jgi:hypothetical protein
MTVQTDTKTDTGTFWTAGVLWQELRNLLFLNYLDGSVNGDRTRTLRLERAAC